MNAYRGLMGVAVVIHVIQMAVLWPNPAQARTFVIPHVLESSGRISSTQYTFDTTLFMTYVGGVGPIPDAGGATADLFLFNNTGQPLLSATSQPICLPCQFALSAASPRVQVSLEELAILRGGLPAGGFTGFATVVTGGVGADQVYVEALTANSGGSTADVRGRPLEPWDPNLPPAGTYVVPHVLETSGKAAQYAFCADTRIELLYTGGLPGVAGGQGDATVDLFLYATNGVPMTASGGAAVCNPCNFTLNAASRKRILELEDLIISAGGFDSAVKEGLAVLQIGGSHPGQLCVDGMVVQSLVATNMLATAPLSFEPPGAGGSSRTHTVPHLFDQKGRVSAVDSLATASALHLVNPAALGSAAAVDSFFDIFIFDSVTGEPWKSKTGKDVCNPLTVALGGASPAATLRLQDAADAAGGMSGGSHSLNVVLEARGPDAGALCFSTWTTTTRDRAFNQDRMIQGMPDALGGGDTRKFFLLPYFEMDTGLAVDRPYSRDTVVNLSMPFFGSITNTGVTVDFFLRDSAGAPLLSATGREVCNPCTASLDAGRRTRKIVLDQEVLDRGGFDTVVKTGFGILVVGGADPENVKVQGFVVNSHTTAMDLSVFGFNPQEISSASAVPVAPLSSTVTDSTGAGVGGVRMNLLQGAAVRSSLTTDESGQIRLYPSTGTVYRLQPEKAGFAFAPPFFDIPFMRATNIVFAAARTAPSVQDLITTLALSVDPSQAVAPGRLVQAHASIIHAAGDVATNTFAELRLPAGFLISSIATNTPGMTVVHDAATQRLLIRPDFSSAPTNSWDITGIVLTEPSADRLVSFWGSEDSHPGLFPGRVLSPGDAEENADLHTGSPPFRLSGPGETCDDGDNNRDFTVVRTPFGGFARRNDANLIGRDGLPHTLEAPVALQSVHLLDHDLDGRASLVSLTQPLGTLAPAMCIFAPDLDADGYGDTSSAANLPFNAGQTVVDSLVGDMNGDGRPDLVVLLAAGVAPGEARIYASTGSPVAPYFSSPQLLATPPGPLSLVRLNLNSDCRADLVAISPNNVRSFTSRLNGSGGYDEANMVVPGTPTQWMSGISSLGFSGQPADGDADLFGLLGNRILVYENTSGGAAPLTANGFIALDATPPAQGMCMGRWTDADSDNDGGLVPFYIDPVSNVLKYLSALATGGYGPPVVVARLAPGATRVFSLDGTLDGRTPLVGAYNLEPSGDYRDDDSDGDRLTSLRLVVAEPGRLLVLSGNGDGETCDDGNINTGDFAYRLWCGKTTHLRVAVGDVCGDGIPDLVTLGETGVLNFSLHAGSNLRDPTPENNSAFATLRRAVGDSAPPSASLVCAPSGGTVLEGSSIQIQMQATDNVAIRRVDLLLQRGGQPDDVLVHMFGAGDALQHEFTVPYNLEGQTIRLRANVYDPDGNTASATSFPFQVVGGTGDDPPSVSLLIPSGSAGWLESPGGIRAVASDLYGPPPPYRPGSTGGVVAYQVFRVADATTVFTNGLHLASAADARSWSIAADADVPGLLVDPLGGVLETAVYTLRPVYADGTLGDFSPVIQGIHRLVLHDPDLTASGGFQFGFPTAPGESYVLQHAELPGDLFQNGNQAWLGNGAAVQVEATVPAGISRRVFQIERKAVP